MGIKRFSSIAASLLILAAFSPALVQGGWLDEATVTPIIGVTNNSLDYRRAAAPANRQATFNSLSVSLGVAGEKWYGRVNAEWPLAPGQYLAGGVQTIRRTDYSVTAGYAPIARASVFGGYLATNIDMSSSGWLENQNDTGPFLGATYDLYRGKRSTVTASLAYAYLSGAAVRTSTGPVTDFSVTGNTTGFSYGLSWAGQLGKNGHSYILSYKIQDFRFDGASGINAPQTIDKDYGVLAFAIVL